MVTGATLDARPGMGNVAPGGGRTGAEWTWKKCTLMLGAARLDRYRMPVTRTYGTLLHRRMLPAGT